MESKLTKDQNQVIINKVKRGPYQSMPNTHWHQGWELYYLVSGERNFLIGGELSRVKQDMLVLIPPRVIHQTFHLGEKAHERFFVFIPNQLMDELFELVGKEQLSALLSPKVFNLPIVLREEIVSILSSMLYEQEHKDNLTKIVLDAKIVDLLVLLIRHLELSTLPIAITEVSDAIIQKVLLQISHDYALPLTLEGMAKAYNLSPSYFSRKFSAVSGISWKEYVTQVRLQKACAYLLETKKSIGEVAALCGYVQANYFGEVFRKEYGMSPQNFRKRQKVR